MDIVRAFTDAGLERGVTINIQGTSEDPLFQASQIGALLGLVNIRETIKEFDDDEKWVAKVVKEIRLTGKYEMEKRFAVANEAVVQEHQLALDAARFQLEDQATLVAARDAELAKIRTKIYEELPRLDHVYINKEVAELASDTHKIGKAIEPRSGRRS